MILICIFVLKFSMKSYVLGEIPSLSDRITLVRQLWSLTKDVLVRSIEFLAFDLAAAIILLSCQTHYEALRYAQLFNC